MMSEEQTHYSILMMCTGYPDLGSNILTGHAQAKFALTNQKHYLDLDSDNHAISMEFLQPLLRLMSAVF